MSDPYCGEIRIWANQYNPYGWAYCNGAPLSVLQNQELYAVIGNLYGGNTQTYYLPDLRNRAPIGVGPGPGLTQRTMATAYGHSTITISATTMASHNHGLNAVMERCKNTAPSATMYMGIAYNSTSAKVVNLYKTATTTPTLSPMSTESISPSCGGTDPAVLPHQNMQPSLAMIFCIALDGVFPVQP
jgi:microcystin-dependent protein